MIKKFFRNFWGIVILVWFLVKNWTIKIFNKFFLWLKFSKKKIKFFLILFTSLAILSAGYHFWSFCKTEMNTKKFNVSLAGEFNQSKKVFSVAEGIVVFEFPVDTLFLLDYGDEIGRGKFPWDKEKIIFIKATFNGEERLLSAEKCWMSIPRDGNLTMEIAYNSEYFDPKQVKIFTGVRDDSPTGFVGGYLFVNIFQHKSDEEIGRMPEVEDIPKPQPPISSDTPTPEVETEAENGKKTFFGIPLPDLSEDKKGDEKSGILNPLSLEKQRELKDRWNAASEEGARLWNNFFSTNKKGEKK